MKAYGISDVGRKRKNNEDAYIINNVEIYREGKKKVIHLLAVADGMGGHEAGEVASKMTVEKLGATPMVFVEEGKKGLNGLIHFINRKVHEESKRRGKKMGTTLVGAVIEDYMATIFNVGDSRAYLFRHGSLRRITRDHSVVQQKIESGEITEEEARRDKDRHRITMAVGLQEDLNPDFYSLELNEGDILLFCTDGLHDMLNDKEIEEIAKKYEKLSDIVGELVKRANEKGGIDNITIVVARI